MNKRNVFWLVAIAFVVAVRLATLDAYPLADTTEARYAEIARLMVESDDWIVPQIETGVPFWGKPPLSTWLTALSFQAFNFGEFAARLPALLLTLATGWIVFLAAGVVAGRESAIAASGVFLTTVIAFVLAGAVMTDAALLLATTLCLYSFAGIASGDTRRHPWWFFVGLGLGLLAKGPVAVVLVLLPVGAWSLVYRGLPWLYRALPWWRGLLLTLAIAVPWYALAEAQSPGFLQYFLVGEHWHRFLDSGWSGDLYGHAHAEPRGTIWLFGIAAALPWSIPALFAAGIAVLRGDARTRPLPQTGLLLAWTLSPLLLFTLAGNILPTYILPGLPAFAILMACWLQRRSVAFVALGLGVPLLVAATMTTDLPELIDQNSQKGLITYQQQSMPGTPLYFYPEAPYSARFYSGGTTTSLRDGEAFAAFLDSDESAAIAIRNTRLPQERDLVLQCLEPVRRFAAYSLFSKPPAACAAYQAAKPERQAAPKS